MLQFLEIEAVLYKKGNNFHCLLPLKSHFLTLIYDIYGEKDLFNPLMPGDNKKVTHTHTNLQLKAAGLFKYV